MRGIPYRPGIAARCASCASYARTHGTIAAEVCFCVLA